MLLITCPVCAITAPEPEFSCGGLYASDDAEARYARTAVREWWLCGNGCGSWFGLMRHSVSQRLYAVWKAGGDPPPLPGEAA